jgi:uncharacterized delta-60 repeat protein
MSRSYISPTAAVALSLLLAAPCAVALAPSSPGSVDPTYGAGGVLALSVRSGYESANAIVPTPDGKWLVSGGAQSAGQQEDGVRYLVRLNADGRIDTTFGNQGYVYDNYFSRVLIVQASGRILAASIVEEGTFTKAVLRRLLPDGSRDMAFGVANGETVIWTGNATLNYQDFEHFQIDAQGRIVATSRVFAGNDFSAGRVEVWRFSADGIPDQGFGVGGRSSLEDIAPVMYNSIARIAADGRIVIAMWCQTAFKAKTKTCAVRLGANGARDATFGPNGMREFVAPAGGNFPVYEVQVAPNGKVYIVGTYTDGHPGKGVVLRLNVDGTPDLAYGTLGAASLTSALDTTYLFWMQLLADGRQLLGGYSTDRQSDAYGFVARLTADGQPDLPFGTAGMSTRVIAASHFFSDFAVLADGSVLGVGSRTNVFNSSNDVDSIFIRYVGVEIKTQVVEFYNGLLDHYFVSADPNEAAAIDSGAAGPGWARTGQSF